VRLETRNPDAGRRQGFGLELVLQAGSDLSSTTFALDHQDALAVRRLAARFGLAPSTASAVATANGWGGPHG